MVKRNEKLQASRLKQIIQPEGATLSILRQEAELWYRLHVLLYDLSNVGNDALSEKRICSTTNELYISEPYFTESEALKIRTATVDVIGTATTNPATEVDDETNVNALKPAGEPPLGGAAVEEMIHARLNNFFIKRKAGGDARPCGPHDMLPIYLSIFGIEKADLKDDRFLSRVRRSGLGDFRSSESRTADDQGSKHDKSKRKDKKDSEV